MRILELTTYSAGTCGVFARVREESIRLAKKGHKVAIFSTNHTKGSSEIASSRDSLGSVSITRFPAHKLGGESFSSWKFDKEALAFNPDIIITHAYRHTHTTRALKIGNHLKIPVFLVTHAPFERSETRSLLSKIAVSFYDSFIARKKLNKFTKIIAITNWEIPYLLRLKIPKEKIAYIPNGIPEEFFKIKKAKTKEENKILFLGRISPIKNLETAIKALPLINDKSIKLEIVGPTESNYLQKLKALIFSLNLANRVIFSHPILDIKEKIKKIDEARIFILPSISEGMPQSLVEALARGKLVLASKNPGNSDLIQDSKNGFLFPVANAKALASLLDKTLSLSSSKAQKIKNTARLSVKQFVWPKIINKINKIIQSKNSDKIFINL
ncbi:MAG: glycosyltransferase family 4 protein [Nanoarchaeota archaeon]